MAQKGHNVAQGWTGGSRFWEEDVFGVLVVVTLLAALYMVHIGTAHEERLRAERAKVTFEQR